MRPPGRIHADRTRKRPGTPAPPIRRARQPAPRKSRCRNGGRHGLHPRMKALLVDDERIARQELRRLLAAHPEIEIAAEAQNGEQALDLILKLAPDVIFLDIQMPEMTGFALLTRLDDVPQIIFTTAYDQYAFRAFEVSALDYLVNPIAPARLAAAIAKLRPRKIPPRLEQV